MHQESGSSKDFGVLLADDSQLCYTQAVGGRSFLEGADEATKSEFEHRPKPRLHSEFVPGTATPPQKPLRVPFQALASL